MEEPEELPPPAIDLIGDLLPIEAILEGDRPEPEGLLIGTSREGREIRGHRFGSGPLKVSLIAGCHADEPVGPAMLRRLAGFLATREPDHPGLRQATWFIVPHVNPDGEFANRGWSGRTKPVLDHLQAADRGYEFAPYLEEAVRELPGDDMEWGFPVDESDRDARPENLAVADFLRPGAPFSLHASFHSMGFAAGPWFLLEPSWVEATADLQLALCQRVEAMGYDLHDVDRQGEKGFHRICPGFCTRPDSRAMAAHFIDRGDAKTASTFQPSSMEWVGSLGENPLTLVSEMPLFLLPSKLAPPLEVTPSSETGNTPEAPPHPTGTEGRLAFLAWMHQRRAQLSPERFRVEVESLGLRAMPIRDQMRLQLAFLEQGLFAVANKT